MKKFLLFGMSIAIALAFTVSSCGSKEEAPAPVANVAPAKQEVKKPEAPKKVGISVSDFQKKATYYTVDKKMDKVVRRGQNIVFSSKIETKEFAIPSNAVVIGSARGPEKSSASLLVTVKESGKTKWLVFFADPAQAKKYRVWYTPGEDLFYWANNSKPDAKVLK